MKTLANKVQIVNEIVDKQSQNTHVEVNIFARQKSKARSRVRIVENNLHIAEAILVPRGRAPFGQHQESRPLAFTAVKRLGIRVNTRDCARFLRHQRARMSARAYKT